MMRSGLFDLRRKASPPQAKRVTAIAAVVSLSPFFVMGLLGLRVNLSPSLPLGFYVTTTVSDAPLIEFCPSEPFASFAAARGYRPEGNCPDGAAPLMKPVVARGGDLVNVSSLGIAVNGELIANTAPKSTDTSGRPMKAWPFGRYKVSTSTVWVASSYNARSFDSRYFGPIPVSAIRNRLRPIFILP
jgi:conjugative transfer signal peptidase TraF